MYTNRLINGRPHTAERPRSVCERVALSRLHTNITTARAHPSRMVVRAWYLPYIIWDIIMWGRGSKNELSSSDSVTRKTMGLLGVWIDWRRGRRRVQLRSATTNDRINTHMRDAGWRESQTIWKTSYRYQRKIPFKLKEEWLFHTVVPYSRFSFPSFCTSSTVPTVSHIVILSTSKRCIMVAALVK
jgi:hypothetical protein